MKSYALIDYCDKRLVYDRFECESDEQAIEKVKCHYNLFYLGLYAMKGRKRLYEIDFRKEGRKFLYQMQKSIKE